MSQIIVVNVSTKVAFGDWGGSIVRCYAGGAGGSGENPLRLQSFNLGAQFVDLSLHLLLRFRCVGGGLISFAHGVIAQFERLVAQFHDLVALLFRRNPSIPFSVPFLFGSGFMRRPDSCQ